MHQTEGYSNASIKRYKSAPSVAWRRDGLFKMRRTHRRRSVTVGEDGLDDCGNKNKADVYGYKSGVVWRHRCFMFGNRSTAEGGGPVEKSVREKERGRSAGVDKDGDVKHWKSTRRVPLWHAFQPNPAFQQNLNGFRSRPSANGSPPAQLFVAFLRAEVCPYGRSAFCAITRF
jgi:hypothetical protein